MSFVYRELEPEPRYRAVYGALKGAKEPGSLYATITLAKLSAGSGIPPRTVKRHIARLEAGGWIEKVRRNGYQGAGVYRITGPARESVTALIARVEQEQRDARRARRYESTFGESYPSETP